MPLLSRIARLFRRPARPTRRPTTFRPQVAGLEDRWVPSVVTYTQTVHFETYAGNLTVDLTVTYDAPGAEDLYTWNYRVTNDSFDLSTYDGSDVHGLNLFEVDFMDSVPEVASATSTVWGVGAAGATGVHWSTNGYLEIGQSGDFSFVTAPRRLAPLMVSFADFSYYSDDEPAGPGALKPEVTVEKLADAVEGGSSGIFRFTRTGDPGSYLEANYSVVQEGGSATPGADYTLLSGVVEFAYGESYVDVELEPMRDNEVEGVETVRVQILPGLPVYRLGADPAQITAVALIADDPPKVKITLAKPVVTETSDGSDSSNFLITRVGGDTTKPLLVKFQLSGTAGEADMKENHFYGEVTIAAGQTSVLLPATPVQDDKIEGDETLTLTLQPLGTRYIVDTPSSASLTIKDWVKSAIRGTVWSDLNVDGLKSSGELVIAAQPPAGVMVQLLDAANNNASVRDPVKVNTDGSYEFVDVLPGSYRVKFTVPNGYLLTLQNAPGSTAANNSDPDRVSGLTGVITAVAGAPSLNYDAGLMRTDYALPSVTGPAAVPGGGTYSYTVAAKGVQGAITWVAVVLSPNNTPLAQLLTIQKQGNPVQYLNNLQETVTLQTAEIVFKNDMAGKVRLDAIAGGQVIASREVTIVRIEVAAGNAAVFNNTVPNANYDSAKNLLAVLPTTKAPNALETAQLSATVTVTGVANNATDIGRIKVGFTQIVMVAADYARYTRDGVPADRYLIGPSSFPVPGQDEWLPTYRDVDNAFGDVYYSGQEASVEGFNQQQKTIKMYDVPSSGARMDWANSAPQTIAAATAAGGSLDWISSVHRDLVFFTYITVSTLDADNGANNVYTSLFQFEWGLKSDYTVTSVTPTVQGGALTGIAVQGMFSQDTKAQARDANAWSPVTTPLPVDLSMPTANFTATIGTPIYSNHV